MSQTKSNASFVYIAALLCLLAVSVFMFTKSDFFSVGEIRIEGLSNLAEEEVLKLLGTVQGQNIFLVDGSVLVQRTKLHPLVDQVTVEKRLPATLFLHISERVPAALILQEDGVVEVDLHGTVLRFHETWPKTGSPVITGISVPDTLGPGQKISSVLLEKALLLLGQAPPTLLVRIGEVNVHEDGQIFLCLSSGMEVRLGHNEEFAGKLNILNELLENEEYKSVEKAIKYIDITAGNPVLGL